jgi:transposase-like protein
VREEFEAIAATDDPLDALDSIGYVREWLRIAELRAIKEARESGESLSGIGGALATDRQNVHQKLRAATRTKGVTAPEFDGVSSGTLRYWYRWWSKPERTASGAHEGGRDPMAERQEVLRELEARWNAGQLRKPPPPQEQ